MAAIAAAIIFYKLTTHRARARWWWNLVAVIVICGALGLAYTVVKTGSMPEPSGEYQR